ncbi:truncated FRIGIDA-like protein 1 [Phalaenopsis equestris]|uniref:truncated FRIGIDA-like protein 1 n=1 Tax=Phalaenopsis equestris TaxID=78828 RepID=UPI0009E1DC47|nr:truncated FRIGIDA-like protein 1 [Phalaenopsis equestris]
MDTTADIQAAINSIPAKKEDLRKAFEELQSCSSFLPSFTLQWKNIDDHFSSIEKSIDKRFQEIKSRGPTEKPTATVSSANVQVEHDKPVIEPCPELKSFCVKMEAKGLQAYIIGHWTGIEAIRRELGPALLYSPDPVTLVLDAYEDLDGSSEMMENGVQAIWRAYLTILECFHGLKLEVKPSDKERARQVAKKCDDLIKNGKKDNAVVVMVFLHVLAAFGLFEYFVMDDVLNLLVTVADKRNIVDLCRNSALEVKIPGKNWRDLLYLFGSAALKFC